MKLGINLLHKFIGIRYTINDDTLQYSTEESGVQRAQTRDRDRTLTLTVDLTAKHYIMDEVSRNI